MKPEKSYAGVMLLPQLTNEEATSAVNNSINEFIDYAVIHAVKVHPRESYVTQIAPIEGKSAMIVRFEFRYDAPDNVNISDLFAEVM